MSEEEKRKEVKDMKFLFGRILSEDERLSDMGGIFSKKEEILYFSIQHYDIDGNFIKQWPDTKFQISDEIKSRVGSILVRKKAKENEIDSSYEFIKPLDMASGADGNIYVADYEGNKVVKFDEQGAVLSLWKIDRKEALGGYYDDLAHQRGLSVAKDKIYIVSEALKLNGSEESSPFVPRLSEYDLNGKLIREKTVKPPKVPAQMPITGKKIPLLKSEGNVRDMAVDKEGNIYLFAADTRIVKLDNQWNEKGYFKTVLEEGFEKPKPVYDPDRQRTINYEDIILKGTGVSFHGFSSDKVSWIENGPGLYYGNKIHLSPDNEIIVSFIGNKPFGVIDAMIIDRTGKMLGYWKQDKKSYSAWFDKLTDLEKLETADVELDIAFQGNNVFIGRTLKEGTNERKYHTVIQKFVKEGA